MRRTVPLLLALASCITTRQTAPAHGDGEVLWRSEVSGAWEVRVRGAAVGRVVRQDLQEGGRFLVVQNAYGQDLGLIDGQGMAWRARPHREHEWVVTGTVAEGVAGILGHAEVQLVPLDTPSQRP